MTAAESYVTAAFLAICVAAIWLPSLWQQTTSRRPQLPSRPDIDALVESALLDGWDDHLMAEACDTEARNHFAPLSNVEVNRRIGEHMDAACRQLATELDTPQNWSA